MYLHTFWALIRPNIPTGTTCQNTYYNLPGRMTARFWYPVMKNGVIHFLPPEDCPGQKPLREMPMKRFSADEGNFIGLREFGEVE